MKRIVLFLGFALLCCTWLGAQNQRLARGQKTPDLQVKEWIDGREPQQGRAAMIEFFHSGNDASVGRLKTLDELARKGGDKVNIVVLTREDNDTARKALSDPDRAYYSGIDDDGKSFAAFSARYVPYAVIIDKRGRIAWLGNPVSLTDGEILSMMK